MRFRAEHRFSATPDEVTDVLLDAGFHVGLALPDLAVPEVLDRGHDGDPDVVRLRYEFVGHLDPVARRLLDHRRLMWVQDLRIDRAARTGRLTFAAESAADRLHGSAAFTLTPDGGDTVRRLHGEIVLTVPLIRAMAERRIVEGLLRRLDIEAGAIEERVRAGG